jgi:putative transposase
MLHALLSFISTLVSVFKLRRDLALENLALRQQVTAYWLRHPPPKLRPRDRLFWIWLSRFWGQWRSVLVIVKPETVIRWHREGFKFFWTRLSRRERVGRPSINTQVRSLIRQMARANPLWGAPRIYGELLKLGIDVAE